ncbi:inositol-pentakisphosphate 2-kinase [Plakobranchus ocellatus]|uniref:Inositol-pentakisphosphate 2-kinase n=1 Tax=Plakobranchus ocellatus TaxID=259542 RepID=A0AAV4DKY2_9GAST|nr:inositol-pentakisphosphate 2-kinase [Plakobranchus ocellatus]
MDQLDVEGVYQVHSALVAKMAEDPELRSKCCWDGPYKSIAWILGENYGEGQDSGSVRDQVEDDVLKAKRFLVSKTLQDCSIIVAIKPVPLWQENEERDGRLRFGDSLYDFSISVIDLDPKSFDKIPFYYDQALEIATACEKTDL